MKAPLTREERLARRLRRAGYQAEVWGTCDWTEDGCVDVKCNEFGDGEVSIQVAERSYAVTVDHNDGTFTVHPAVLTSTSIVAQLDLMRQQIAAAGGAR